MKYYLANVFKIFQSIFKYKNHESNSYLAINQISDWSPQEVDKLFKPHNIFGAGLEETIQAEHDDLGEKNVSRAKPDNPMLVFDNWSPTFIDKGLPDEIFVDHRESNCLSQIRNQEACGACYAFALVSLYEWVHCNKTGEHKAFSEQYIVDCGHRYGSSGCEGGNEFSVAQFVAACGLETRENYPYQGRQNECPYDDYGDEDKSMGQLRVIEPRLKLRIQTELKEYLKGEPLIVTIAVSKDFHQYGGGIDDAIGCDEMRAHSVLLVGHGRENGKQYWIIRNSFSDKFGEKGYYRLNKAAHCLLARGIGLASKALHKDKAGQPFLAGKNPAYDGKPVQKRIWKSRRMLALSIFPLPWKVGRMLKSGS